MKFAHIADVHIGSWRDPKLKDISTRAFVKAVDECIRSRVDFVLLAGDLFNTAVPGIEFIKTVVSKLKELSNSNIPVYGIPGSHDFSASGKTMLDVLEEAGLFVNVFRGNVDKTSKKLSLKFTVDRKTGAKITGIIGKRGMLDRKLYESLDAAALENEPGFKIFLFHTAIAEIHPEIAQFAECATLSLLPKGFDYYAGGHIHQRYEKNHAGHGMITLPGALFPCNFPELEKHSRGGFFIVEDNRIDWHPVQVFNTHHISVNCSNKTVREVEDELFSHIKDKEFIATIVTIRLSGHLASGKVSDINFRDIYARLYAKSAHFVMKNTHSVTSDEFEEAESRTDAVEDVEHEIIESNAGQIALEGVTIENEKEIIRQLLTILDDERDEGEKVGDFEKRILEEAKTVLNIG